MIRDYVRLSYEWMNDPVMVAIIQEEPLAALAFVRLLCESGYHSHHEDNPDGTVVVTEGIVGTWLGGNKELGKRCLELLVDGEFIVLKKVGENALVGDKLECTVLNFLKWNVPKGSNPHRQQTFRDKKSFAGKKGSKVTDSLRSVTQTETETETESNKELSSKLNNSPETQASVTVSKKPSADYVAKIDVVAQQPFVLANKDLVDSFVDLKIEQNKSGKMAASRLYRECWKPLLDTISSGDYSEAALRYGLEQAVSRAAPNVNYVKKAAAGHNPGDSVGGSLVEESVRMTPEDSELYSNIGITIGEVDDE